MAHEDYIDSNYLFGRVVTMNGGTTTTEDEDCCFYIFKLRVVTDLTPRRGALTYKINELTISCACLPCDTAETSSHTRFTALSPPFKHSWISDNFEYVKKCACGCDDCSTYLGEPCSIAGGDFEFEESIQKEGFQSILAGGSWESLPGYIDDWEESEDVVVPHPNTGCDIPIPTGWNNTADQPDGGGASLDCCTGAGF